MGFSNFFPTFDDPKSKSEKHLFQDYSQCPVPRSGRTRTRSARRIRWTMRIRIHENSSGSTNAPASGGGYRWIVAMFGVNSSPWVVKDGESV